MMDLTEKEYNKVVEPTDRTLNSGYRFSQELKRHCQKIWRNKLYTEETRKHLIRASVATQLTVIIEEVIPQSDFEDVLDDMANMLLEDSEESYDQQY